MRIKLFVFFFCWVAGWRTTCGSHSIRPALQRAARVFSFLCHFSFRPSRPHFRFITVRKRCQSIFTLVYRERPVCSRGSHCLWVAMRNDDDSLRNLSISLLFAPLMNWSMLALPFNHTWQICAMESELFKRHPSIQLARPPSPPPTPTKNGRKYVLNNVEGLKGNYSNSMVRSALEHIP